MPDSPRHTSQAAANLPPTNEGYGTKEYCDIQSRSESPIPRTSAHERQSEPPETNFDWFLSPSYLLPTFEALTVERGKDARILMLGCGNSQLGEVMYDAGWKNIVNVDYSATLIATMAARHSDLRPEMKWLEMDVLDLQFEEGDFDLVVDKGTMDAMLTTKGDPWNPNEKDIKVCMSEVSEALRVLQKRKGSKFV
ncbi:hypothetical protein P7C73_g6532, partial [Tremellales sp. Uapishka_1]